MTARNLLILSLFTCLFFFMSACQQKSGSQQAPKPKPDKTKPVASGDAPTVPSAEKPADVPALEKPAQTPESVTKVSDVWCLPEYYRIDPVSTEVAEWGNKPVTAEFKSKNNIFDAKTNTVSLTGMKGETLAFQIMVEGNHSNVTLQSEGLPSAAQFFYEGYLQWLDGEVLRYTADVPVPMDWIGGSFAVQTVPEQLPVIEGKKMQAVWVDVSIPRTAATGTITGSVTVKAGNSDLSVIPVTITVINAELPEQPSYLNAMICYSLFGRKYPQKERDAYVQMQAHRQSIHEVPYSSQRGWALGDAVPMTTLTPAFKRYDEFRQKAQKMNAAERDAYQYDPEIAKLKDPKNHTVRAKDLEQRYKELMPLHDQLLKACREEYQKNGAGITDWAEFDKRYGPLFDGSAFKDGIPLVSFELPFNFNWPAPLDHFGIMDPRQSKMYEDIWIKVAQDFLKHANEKGWTRTHFFVYFNPKDRGNNLVMWKGDEPCEMNDFLGHKYFNELFWKAFKNPGKIKVDHKIEVGHWECDAAVCRKRFLDTKTWDESNARELLAGFKTWIPNSRHFHSARKLAWKQMEEQGDIFYNYGGLATFNQSSMAIYGLAFLAFEDRTAGYFAYIPGMGDLTVYRDNPGMKIKKTKVAKPEKTVAHYNAAIFDKDDKFLISLHSKSGRSVEHAYAAFQMAARKDPAFGKDLKNRMVKYVVASGGADKGSTMYMTNNNPHDFFAARLKALAIIAGQAGLSKDLAYKGQLKGVKAQTDVFHYCVACGEACGPVKCEWCGAPQKGTNQTPGDASSLILQQGVDDYDGCQDTYADMDKPGHDRDDRLVLESNGKAAKMKAIAVKFVIPESKISPAATVHKATLTLYCMRQSSSSGQMFLHMLNGKWDIPHKYTSAGDLAGKRLGQTGISNYRTAQGNDINPPVPVVFDVTHAVKNWVPDKHINYGVLLMAGKNEYADLRFVPSEDKRVQYRPKLEISYTN